MSTSIAASEFPLAADFFILTTKASEFIWRCAPIASPRSSAAHSRFFCYSQTFSAQFTPAFGMRTDIKCWNHGQLSANNLLPFLSSGLLPIPTPHKVPQDPLLTTPRDLFQLPPKEKRTLRSRKLKQHVRGDMVVRDCDQGLLTLKSPRFLSLEQGSKAANKLLWAKSGPLPAFVNKILLKHSHVHSFPYCLWLVPAITAQLTSDGLYES